MAAPENEPLIILTDADSPAPPSPAPVEVPETKRSDWLRNNWIAITAAAISLFSAGISGWQAYLSNASAQQSKEQFIETQRPVIELEDVKLPAIILTAEGQLSYTVSLDADNKGNSPALNAILVAELRTAGDSQVYYPLRELHDTCVSFDNLGPLAGSVAPQNAKTAMKRQSIQHAQDLVKTIEKTPPATDGIRHINSRMAICVRYEDRFSKTSHHEGKLYDLTINIPPEVFAAIEAKQDVLLKPPDLLSYFEPSLTFNGSSD